MVEIKDRMKDSEEELNEIYKQLSTLASKKLNRLDGWFSETVEDLYVGKKINNLCINGKWPTIYWNGSKLVVE